MLESETCKRKIDYDSITSFTSFLDHLKKTALMFFKCHGATLWPNFNASIGTHKNCSHRIETNRKRVPPMRPHYNEISFDIWPILTWQCRIVICYQKPKNGRIDRRWIRLFGDRERKNVDIFAIRLQMVYTFNPFCRGEEKPFPIIAQCASNSIAVEILNFMRFSSFFSLLLINYTKMSILG